MDIFFYWSSLWSLDRVAVNEIKENSGNKLVLDPSFHQEKHKYDICLLFLLLDVLVNVLRGMLYYPLMELFIDFKFGDFTEPFRALEYGLL